MALKDLVPLGLSLPHRSPEPIAPDSVRTVAQRAEALGFRDLWVTENTLDHVVSFDPIAVLTYAAAVTTTIRLGCSVVVLPVHDARLIAHQWASLDVLSGGRAILGVGIGRPDNFHDHEVPMDGRVTRFREQVALIRSLWSQERTTLDGRFHHVSDLTMPLKPVQKPHMPIWMGAGGSTTADFARSVPILREALERAGRDPATYPISKRVFMAVDEREDRARAELRRWYSEVYFNPEGTETSGVYGTPEQAAEKLAALVEMGANHLLLNPVSRFTEQVEAVAEMAGLA
jgi:alkanesulfonate monooxygenase SsuD/methylene tetrahydromethanopterin reductase-like flavin-dependent oxidoreductase (luciferase family)